MRTHETATIAAHLRAAGCVFAEDEADLLLEAAKTPAQLAGMVKQRVAGQPLEYILGWAQFYGQRIAIDTGVFVPRRRSELLAREAIALTLPGAVVVDLCCGSGAVAAAIGAAVKPIRLSAADINTAAVQCAQRNLKPLGGKAYEGDLYEALPHALQGHINVLVANAPYVPTDELQFMPAEARLHEAHEALDGGADGLDVQRRISAGAVLWLAPAGALLMETSRRQAARTAVIMNQAGLMTRIAYSSELEATVIIGRRETVS